MGQFDKHTCSNKDDVGRQDFKDKAIWGKHSRWTLCTWILWACTTNPPWYNPDLQKIIPSLLAIEDNYYYQLTIWGDKLWGDQLNDLRRPAEDLRGPMQWTICRDELNWLDELNYEGTSWTIWRDQLKIWGDQWTICWDDLNWGGQWNLFIFSTCGVDPHQGASTVALTGIRVLPAHKKNFFFLKWV